MVIRPLSDAADDTGDRAGSLELIITDVYDGSPRGRLQCRVKGCIENISNKLIKAAWFALMPGS